MAAVAALAVAPFCVAARAASDPNVGWMEVRSGHFVVASNAGEKEARRIADQFEQMRALFHAEFSNLRVDPAQPILILAAKNENTMKLLLPENWEAEGRVHPAGLYQQGEDKHYVLLRLDSGGDHPFHALYHEYTHALLHLNFAGLPLWLDEGLAEFYGNSKLGEKESRVGTVDEEHLAILRQHKLLPVETLLHVDQASPYYNEAEQASVFYAESWALVHYLLLDPEAQRQRLLKNFLAAWNKGGDQVEAARETFGDLQRFGRVIEEYSRQNTFTAVLYKNGQKSGEKSYAVRGLSAAEVLTLRGDSATHRKMLEQARPLLAEALKEEPQLAGAHEAWGYYLYCKGDDASADKEMRRAMELDQAGFAAPYYHGMLLLRVHGAGASARQEAIGSLEVAIKRNAQFAPAYEGLAEAYSAEPETQRQALEAGIRAQKLEPAEHAYAISLVYLLLKANRNGDARQLAQRLLEAAVSPEEAQTARALLERIREHEEWLADMQKRAAEAAARRSENESAGAAVLTPERTTESKKAPVDVSTLMAAEGVIRKIDCGHRPTITVTLGGGNRPLVFYAPDMGQVGLSETGGGTVRMDGCEEWKGRRVRVWFMRTKGKEYFGEITDMALE